MDTSDEEEGLYGVSMRRFRAALLADKACGMSLAWLAAQLQKGRFRTLEEMWNHLHEAHQGRVLPYAFRYPESKRGNRLFGTVEARSWIRWLYFGKLYLEDRNYEPKVPDEVLPWEAAKVWLKAWVDHHCPPPILSETTEVDNSTS